MTGPGRLSRWAWGFGCALVSVMLVLPLLSDTAISGTRTPIDANLVRNGKAERGGSSYPEEVVGRVPHWSREGRFTVTEYGIEGFLPRRESERIRGGEKHFACGSLTPTGLAWQRIDLVGRAKAIDARAMKVVVRAYVSAPATGGDRGRLIVRFLDARSDRLKRLASRWVADTARRMIRTHVSSVLPHGTRSVVVMLRGERRSGLICNVYFDNVDLRILPA